MGLEVRRPSLSMSSCYEKSPALVCILTLSSQLIHCQSSSHVLFFLSFWGAQNERVGRVTDGERGNRKYIQWAPKESDTFLLFWLYTPALWILNDTMTLILKWTLEAVIECIIIYIRWTFLKLQTHKCHTPPKIMTSPVIVIVRG